MVILGQGLSDVDVDEKCPGILSNADSDLVALGWVLRFCVVNEFPGELQLLFMGHLDYQGSLYLQI